MNLFDVATEIASKLDTIEGLRATAFRPNRITPPAAFPDWPERINYDETYDRGLDRIPNLPVNVLVGKVSDRASHQKLAAYVEGSGPRSIKATLDSQGPSSYATCDEVHVESVEFAIFTISDVDYLAASFTVDITGKGA